MLWFENWVCVLCVQCVLCEVFFDKFWSLFWFIRLNFLIQNWNETLRILSRWGGWVFDFFVKELSAWICLNLYWVLTKKYRFYQRFFKGIVVWFCDMYLKVGMMVFWHHSINDFVSVILMNLIFLYLNLLKLHLVA